MLNASLQFSFRLNQGNLLETLNMSTYSEKLALYGYQITHMTCRRTGGNETKAYPTIYAHLLITLTGDTLNGNAKGL